MPQDWVDHCVRSATASWAIWYIWPRKNGATCRVLLSASSGLWSCCWSRSGCVGSPPACATTSAGSFLLLAAVEPSSATLSRLVASSWGVPQASPCASDASSAVVHHSVEVVEEVLGEVLPPVSGFLAAEEKVRSFSHQFLRLSEVRNDVWHVVARRSICRSSRCAAVWRGSGGGSSVVSVACWSLRGRCLRGWPGASAFSAFCCAASSMAATPGSQDQKGSMDELLS